MGEKPPLPQWVAVEHIALVVGADVHTAKDQLAVVHVHPGILQVYGAGAKAFYLGADQLNAGFKRFDHKILMAGLAVDRDLFGPCSVCHCIVLLSAV